MSRADRGLRLCAVAVAAGVLIALPAAPAHATYPGENGRIAFSRWEEPEVALVTARPDGTNRDVVAGGAAYHDSSWSANGRMIVAVRGRSAHNATRLVTMRADGSGKRLVLASNEELSHPSFSPSGRRLMYTESSDVTSRVYTVRRDGTGRRRVARDLPGRVADGVWSPNGNRIAFAYQAPEEDRHSIYTIRTDGTGLRRLTSSQGRDAEPDWSPNGKRLVFTRTSADFRDSSIMRIRRDGTGLRRLTDVQGSAEAPAWSPNGTRIVYQRRTAAADTIRIMRADGSNNHRAVSGTRNLEPSWQPRPQ